MEYLTAEQMAELTDDLEGRANITAINKLFREQDESNLHPINGRFNVTERAIRQSRRMQQHTGGCYGLEYAYQLDHLISQIVNNTNI